MSWCHVFVAGKLCGSRIARPRSAAHVRAVKARKKRTSFTTSTEDKARSFFSRRFLCLKVGLSSAICVAGAGGGRLPPSHWRFRKCASPQDCPDLETSKQGLYSLSYHLVSLWVDVHQGHSGHQARISAWFQIWKHRAWHATSRSPPKLQTAEANAFWSFYQWLCEVQEGQTHRFDLWVIFVLNSFLCTFRHSDRKGYHRQEANIKQCLDQIQTLQTLRFRHTLLCVCVWVFWTAATCATWSTCRFLTSKGIVPLAVVLETFRVPKRWLESHKDFFAPWSKAIPSKNTSRRYISTSVSCISCISPPFTSFHLHPMFGRSTWPR